MEPSPNRGTSDSGDQLSFLSAVLHKKYDLWALTNSESVSHIETSLKTLLFFLPGRFREQELGSELFQSALGLFGVYNDAIWLKFTASEGHIRPPLSTLHKDLPARLGIAVPSTDSTSGGDLPPKNEKSNSWVDQYNSFFQLDDPKTQPGRGLDEKQLSPSSTAFSNHSSTPLDPNSLYGSGQISADVQRKLSKLHRRLPQSLHKNFSLHTALSVLDHTELVAEISASHIRDWLRTKLGIKATPTSPAPAPAFHHKIINSLKFVVIFAIEILKACIRLILLFRNGGKVLCNQSIPNREAVVRSVGADDDQQQLVNAMVLRLAGKHQRKTLADVEKEKRKFLPTPASPKLALGELLWIIRPLVYLLSLMKHGKQSWKPWFVSLLFDIASRGCSYSVALNEAETQEMYRRGFLWFFYLLRSPFFEFAMGDPQLETSRLARLFAFLQNIPLVGALSASISEFFMVYRNRYFYTAGSSS